MYREMTFVSFTFGKNEELEENTLYVIHDMHVYILIYHKN